MVWNDEGTSSCKLRMYNYYSLQLKRPTLEHKIIKTTIERKWVQWKESAVEAASPVFQQCNANKAAMPVSEKVAFLLTLSSLIKCNFIASAELFLQQTFLTVIRLLFLIREQNM